MKTFLHILTSVRDGRADGVIVLGGTHYHHRQLLMVIEAEDVERAAQVLNLRITDSFDRSSVSCPTIYYLGHCGHEGSLSLKELEPGDEIAHPDLEEKMRSKVIVPKHPASIGRPA